MRCWRELSLYNARRHGRTAMIRRSSRPPPDTAYPCSGCRMKRKYTMHCRAGSEGAARAGRKKPPWMRGPLLRRRDDGLEGPSPAVSDLCTQLGRCWPDGGIYFRRSAAIFSESSFMSCKRCCTRSSCSAGSGYGTLRMVQTIYVARSPTQ